MMMVSTNEYVLYTCTLYCNIYFLFPKELLVHWARDVYEFNESQMTATVELVTNSTFEVGQVSILGFPRQIPDGDPNRFPALFVPSHFCGDAWFFPEIHFIRDDTGRVTGFKLTGNRVRNLYFQKKTS